MSKLNIDQQTIKELFSNKKSDFLIPDYHYQTLYNHFLEMQIQIYHPTMFDILALPMHMVSDNQVLKNPIFY